MNELIDLTITDAFPHSLRAEVPVLAETPA
jgi:hypothetical protein